MTAPSSTAPQKRFAIQKEDDVKIHLNLETMSPLEISAALTQYGNFLRRIADSTTSNDFKDIWSKSGEDEKLGFSKAINTFDIEGVKRWIREHPTRDLNNLSKIELLDLCAIYKVPYRTRMTCFQMINAIKQARAANETHEACSTDGTEEFFG